MKYTKMRIVLSLCIVVLISMLTSCGWFRGFNQSSDKGTKHETEQVVIDTELDNTEFETFDTEIVVNDTEESVLTEIHTSENPKIESSTNENEPVQNESTVNNSNTFLQQESTTNSSTNNSLSEGDASAQAIVNQIIRPGMSDFEKAITIHDWLLFNIDYDFSFTVYDVENTLSKHVAVCQGYALTFETMAELAGLEAVFIGGTADNGSGYQSHAWNRVKINGTWYNVDVTWDDPASVGKNPSDHSQNGYDYFLISDAELNKNHKASEIPSECGSCSQNYDRLTILRYAANSGRYGDVALVTNTNEANTNIKKYMDMNKQEVNLWIYDASINITNSSSYIQNLVSSVQYPIKVGTFYPSDKGMIKCKIGITPSVEWNAIPVVHNVDEFKALLDKNGDSGVRTYTVRYESTNGEPVIDTSRYGFNISYITYNSGGSWLITVNIV